MEPNRPLARALAIQKSRIVDIGKQDRISALATKKTKILDLEGRTILPGFIDAHSHFLYT